MHKNKRKELLHLGLFEGVGGFGLAAKWNGIETIATCDINEFGNKVTAHHFPEAYKHGDVRTLTKEILDDRLISRYGPDWASRTILTAGFPCQPFSVAGRRAGADDDRYLWPETLRVIAEIRPAWVIGENVAGILSMVQPVGVAEVASESDVFGEVHYTETQRYEFVADRICRDFESVGYSVIPFVIPACAVGAPHRRDRVWFVANRNCTRRKKRGTDRKREKEDSTEWSDIFCKLGGLGEEQSPPNRTDSGAKGVQQEREDRVCESRYAANTCCEGLQRRTSKGAEKNERGSDRWSNRISPWSDSICHWRQFPTVPPICGGDDGISLGLVGISFPNWRRESIAAMGNAVVPQIPQMIINLIKKIENNER